MMIYDAFECIYKNNNVVREYKDRLRNRLINDLSITENVAVSAKLKKSEIVIQNKKICIERKLKVPKDAIGTLTLRDKVTYFCYQYRLFSLLFYLYKITSVLKSIKTYLETKKKKKG